MDCRQGSSVHGILQARTLEWVAIPFCRGSSHPGIKPRSLALQADSFPSEPSGKPIYGSYIYINILILYIHYTWDFPGGASGKKKKTKKKPPANVGGIRDTGSIPRWGRSPGGGHGSPLQCSCLETPTDRGALWATVHRVIKSWTQLKQLSTHIH